MSFRKLHVTLEHLRDLILLTESYNTRIKEVIELLDAFNNRIKDILEIVKAQEHTQ